MFPPRPWFLFYMPHKTIGAGWFSKTSSLRSWDRRSRQATVYQRDSQNRRPHWKAVYSVLDSSLGTPLEYIAADDLLTSSAYAVRDFTK